MHHGVKGQKWGIRRYQNSDGTLTSEGRKRYNVDMYSHSGNRIYSPLGASSKVQKRSNAANSLLGGDVYNDFESKLRKQLKNDYKRSYKKGYITKDEYRQGKKIAKSSSKLIAEQRLGKTAKKYGKRVKIINGVARGTITAAGATLAALQARDAINGARAQYRANVDSAQRYGGYGTYQEINNDGSKGQSHTPWKEVYKDRQRQQKGKKSEYGYYSFNCEDGQILAHHGIKGMHWGVRKNRDEYRTERRKKVKRIISNTKSFAKSKKGRKALATAAGIGAASGLAIGAMTSAAKIKAKKDMQRLRNASAEQYLRDHGMLFEYDKFEY